MMAAKPISTWVITSDSRPGSLTRDCNYTTGQIYLSVIEKERKGQFLGKTVQVIPHITNEIKSVIKRMGGDNVDVVITEIGGTVGDIESLPFLEAIRQFSLDVGRDNCLVHAFDTGALPQSCRRIENQAHPTLSGPTSGDWYSA